MERARVEPFTFVSHALAAAAAMLVLVWCIHFRGGLAYEATDKSLIFNLTPVNEFAAIMSYRSLPLSKDARKRIHLILHAIALALGAFGIHAAFKFHNESGIDNLYSLHSWVGLGTISLYGLQWIIGFFTFFYPGAADTLKRSAIRWHALFGIFVFILAVGNAQLGFLEKLTFLERTGFNKYGSEALLVNFTALVVILLGASVVISTLAPSNIEETKKSSVI
ncbi:putative ascorbate-specific transmembrane electron transporter 1 [Ananas comosus]|uniref:Putative ascorbate-specific transmembrane electron transporter 1 n=1 Tax=Ananas comosus TaxID=4615 RepID=A0A199V1T8_ANACO|nr:putative ascorbate-specific transmembrane electron transporter 1 [Ananas comosus]